MAAEAKAIGRGNMPNEAITIEIAIVNIVIRDLSEVLLVIFLCSSVRPRGLGHLFV